ncbi:hypothetical protein QBC46DRAFT_438093 [Diplogelasinospora grovesii]|uniref:Rhodopsin domain-containing protein n=1 Tax=Diplogelasinospora grovesii TaxID=303347 RepID=A0AAN6S4D4_9PEZI|nr:hypothetical protein QBC46DRAFT_438093 [Diplogelasinospora grovesii]
MSNDLVTSVLLTARNDGVIDTRASTIYGFMAAFGPLAFVAVCLRLYTRLRFAKLGWDDLAVVVCLILYIGLIIATIYAIIFGLGRHIWDVPIETEVSMQKCGFTSQVLYPPALCAVKLSILLFLLRTLPPGHPWKNPLRVFAGYVAIEESAFTIALFLQCRPIYFYWDKTVEGTCFNQPAFYYADAALNMATDLCILALPWLIFRNLNISRRRKYELLGICSVGVFTLISSTVRLPYLHDLNISTDPTWHVVDICIWSIAELGSAITLCSVPAIRPLIAHVFPRAMASTPSAKSANSGKTSGLPHSRDTRATHRSKLNGSALVSHPTWHSYTELDDIDGASQKRSVNSSEHILAAEQGEMQHTMSGKAKMKSEA